MPSALRFRPPHPASVQPQPSANDASTRVFVGSSSPSEAPPTQLLTEEAFVFKLGRRAGASSRRYSKHSSAQTSAVFTRPQRTKKKKSVRFPVDDMEFYSNIWTPPTVLTPPKKFIDIVQIAYVVASMQDTDTYSEAVKNMEMKNIWSDDSASNETDLEEPEASPAKPSSSAAKSAHKQLAMDRAKARLGNGTIIETVDEEHSMNAKSSSRRNDLDEVVAATRSVPVAPPSQRDDTHAVFSAVLTGAYFSPASSWSARFLLALHEPIRHALYVIDRFLEQSHLSDNTNKPAQWDMDAFFAWFIQCFVQLVEAQHMTKALVLAPLLPIAYPVKREILDCYEEVYFMLETVRLHEDNIAASKADIEDDVTWRQSIRLLQQDVRKLNEILRDTLDLEERNLVTALEKTFTAKAFDDYVMPRVLREIPHKRVVVPWIVERCRIWGSNDEAEAFRQHLSLPSRFLYDHRWYPFFLDNVAGGMKLLDKSLTNFPKQNEDESVWFGCLIQ